MYLRHLVSCLPKSYRIHYNPLCHVYPCLLGQYFIERLGDFFIKITQPLTKCLDIFVILRYYSIIRPSCSPVGQSVRGGKLQSKIPNHKSEFKCTSALSFALMLKEIVFSIYYTFSIQDSKGKESAIKKLAFF